MCLIPLLDWRGVCPQIETLVLILSFESLIYFQQAYFKCAYDCFDRRRNQEGINNCVENCSVPVLTANNLVENEMAKFQVPLIFGTMSCRCFFPPQTEQHRSGMSLFSLFSCSNLFPLLFFNTEILIG